MLQEIKRLGKHSAIYGLGGVFNAILGLILLPIYTRFLTPADYGILSLLMITLSVLGVVVQMGLGSAMFREVIYRGTDRRVVQRTVLLFYAVEAVAVYAVLYLLAPVLSELIFTSRAYVYPLRLISATVVLGTVHTVLTASLRLRERSFSFSLLAALRLVVGATLNIYFVAILRRGVNGLILAGLIQEALFAAINLGVLFPELRARISGAALRRLLVYGVPLVPFGIARLVMTSADRYFLQHLSTTTEVGLYSLGYNLGMVVNLAVTAIQLAWPARMFEIAKGPDAEEKFSRMLTYYLLTMGFLALVISTLAPEALIVLATPAFYGAASVVPLIALSYILYGAMYITNTGLETANKIKWMSPAIVAAAVLNLVLNYLWIPGYGMMGAAWATLASYLVLFAILLAVNLRYWFIRYEYRRIGKVTVAWGIVFVISRWVPTDSLWGAAILKVLLLTAYPVLLFALRFPDAKEQRVLQRYLPWVGKQGSGS